MDELIVKILKAIYWRTLTDKEDSALKSILNDNDFSNSEKANLICEYLQIEKRGNRSEITNVLNSEPPLNR